MKKLIIFICLMAGVAFGQNELLQGSGKGNVKKSDSLTTFVTPSQLADTVSAINRVGNVASGTWLASVVGLSYGGTGTALANGSAGQVLKSDGDGTASWGTAGGSDSVWNIVTLGSDPENANGTLNFVASDGDAGNVAINTDDALTFNDFGGGYTFDDDISITKSEAVSVILTSSNGSVAQFLDSKANNYAVNVYREGGAAKWATGINFPADNDNDFSLYNYGTASNNFLIDFATGRLGFGTNTPTGRLTVDGNKTTDNLLELVNDDDGAVGDSSVVVTKLALVGVGTNSPSARLHLYERRTGNDVIFKIESAAAGDILAIDEDGDWLSYYKIQIRDNVAIQYGNNGDFSFLYNESGDDEFQLQDISANEFLGVKDQGTTADFDFNEGQVFFKNDGKIGIGTISNTTSLLKVDGQKTTDNLLELVNDDDGVAAAADSGMVVSKLGGIYSSVLNGGAINLTADASGNIIRDPAGDIRFKQNIYGITDPLDKLVNLRGVRFTYKESEKMPGIHYGMVAQEVEKVVPELVSEGADGRLSVRYTNMVALLVEAVKDQQLQIYELQKQVNELRCKK